MATIQSSIDAHMAAASAAALVSDWDTAVSRGEAALALMASVPDWGRGDRNASYDRGSLATTLDRWRKYQSAALGIRRSNIEYKRATSSEAY